MAALVVMGVAPADAAPGPSTEGRILGVDGRFPGVGDVRASSTPSGERLFTVSTSVQTCDEGAEELVLWVVHATDGLDADVRIDAGVRTATARMDGDGDGFASTLRTLRYDGCDATPQAPPISDVSGTVDVDARVTWQGRGPVETESELLLTRAATARGIVSVGAPVSRTLRLPRTDDATFEAFAAIEE